MRRFNPYNIVKQGEIGAIATADKSTILTVIKEVAGAGSHDRADKLVRGDLDTADLLQAELAERVEKLTLEKAELERDRESLAEYRDLEVKAVAAASTLLKRSMQAVKKKMAALKADKEELLRTFNGQRILFEKVKSEKEEQSAAFVEVTEAESDLREKRSEAKRSMDLLNEEVVKVKREMEDVRQGREERRKNQVDLVPKLEAVKADIEAKEAGLSGLEDGLNEARSRMTEVKIQSEKSEADYKYVCTQ